MEVEITCYALVGSSTPRTIRVKGNVKTVSLVNLLDFGSIHNFVDATLTSVLHIPIDESQILAVQVPMMMLLRHMDCVRMSQCSCMAKYFFFSFAIIAVEVEVSKHQHGHWAWSENVDLPIGLQDGNKVT